MPTRKEEKNRDNKQHSTHQKRYKKQKLEASRSFFFKKKDKMSKSDQSLEMTKWRSHQTS
jgi:hypothetical protein